MLDFYSALFPHFSLFGKAIVSTALSLSGAISWFLVSSINISSLYLRIIGSSFSLKISLGSSSVCFRNCAASLSLAITIQRYLDKTFIFEFFFDILLEPLLRKSFRTLKNSSFWSVTPASIRIQRVHPSSSESICV